nr:MAG TPA: hypothetical protein [Caudoviricetes sp.]
MIYLSNARESILRHFIFSACKFMKIGVKSKFDPFLFEIRGIFL